MLRECLPLTMCHMSGVTCHMSHVRCQVSCVTFFLNKVVELIGEGSFINGAYPVQFLPYLHKLSLFYQTWSSRGCSSNSCVILSVLDYCSFSIIFIKKNIMGIFQIPHIPFMPLEQLSYLGRNSITQVIMAWLHHIHQRPKKCKINIYITQYINYNMVLNIKTNFTETICRKSNKNSEKVIFSFLGSPIKLTTKVSGFIKLFRPYILRVIEEIF